MNRRELIDEVQGKLPEGTTKTQVDEFITAFTETVESAVTTEGKVQLVGFGTFERKEIKGREGISHLQGEDKAWKTEDSYGVKFKVGKAFENKVNGK